MKHLEDKIDCLHEKVRVIQEKSNQLHANTEKKIKELDDRVFSQEIRITKIEQGKPCKTKKSWKISCVERLFWVAFIIGFFSYYFLVEK